jgi:NADH-quinone oxidoreductase subunit G
LSDRDRFSYEGIYSTDRLQSPQIKENGEWRTIDWEEALAVLADTLGRANGNKTGLLASPGATLEEAHLLARIAAYLETSNIDHRIGRRDFSAQDTEPVFPWLGCEIAELEQQDAILVVGSNIRHEAPILAHRLRKASLAGAGISFANSTPYEYFFNISAYASGAGLVELLAGIAVAVADGKKLPPEIAALAKGVEASDVQKRIAKSLQDAENSSLLLGNIAFRHSAFAAVRDLAAYIAASTGTKLGFVTAGANTAGAHLAGVLPHREVGGSAREKSGMNAQAMLAADLDALLLLNLEPGADLVDVSEQDFVAALTPYDSESLREAADLLLPIGTFAETSGTYINVAGTWQSFSGIAKPVGEARPAWKVLRVLGNLLEIDGFDYVSSEDVRDEVRKLLGEVSPSNQISKGMTHAAINGEDTPADEIDVPLYSADSVVRRATALQMTPAARRAKGDGV